jgi:hypothetical protein
VFKFLVQFHLFLKNSKLSVQFNVFNLFLKNSELRFWTNRYEARDSKQRGAIIFLESLVVFVDSLGRFECAQYF